MRTELKSIFAIAALVISSGSMAGYYQYIPSQQLGGPYIIAAGYESLPSFSTHRLADGSVSDLTFTTFWKSSCYDPYGYCFSSSNATTTLTTDTQGAVIGWHFVGRAGGKIISDTYESTYINGTFSESLSSRINWEERPFEITYATSPGRWTYHDAPVPGIPEPSVAALMLAGSGLLVFRSRRRTGRTPEDTERATLS
ncbi:MAG TPA: PEP-CTERM sorting domain-containing protein [Burkholderiaceae bacterium]|nr:PEP-CTERM sorting domain-containing protein [Burkholderiaceae bacterium]